MTWPAELAERHAEIVAALEAMKVEAENRVVRCRRDLGIPDPPLPTIMAANKAADGKVVDILRGWRP